TLVVNTPAAVHMVSETISATSFLFRLWVLTPTWIPAARNPLAAHTPPAISFMLLLLPYRSPHSSSQTEAPFFTYAAEMLRTVFATRPAGGHTYSSRPAVSSSSS